MVRHLDKGVGIWILWHLYSACWPRYGWEFRRIPAGKIRGWLGKRWAGNQVRTQSGYPQRRHTEKLFEQQQHETGEHLFFQWLVRSPHLV